MRRRQCPIATGKVALLLVTGLALVAGCSTTSRQRLMQLVFDNPPAPGESTTPPPYQGRPRRPPPYKPKPPPLVKVKVYVPAFQRDWKALWRKLPKTAAGGVDWVRALEKGIIKPRPGLDKKAQPQPVLPLDVHLKPEGQPLFEVTYPHKPHTEWLACTNCHPKIFHMRAGADPITMEKIFQGQYCGRCHGKVAFAPATGCPRCHRKLAGPKK